MTEDDDENRLINAEVQDITHFYSPINDDTISNESPTANSTRKGK